MCRICDTKNQPLIDIVNDMLQDDAPPKNIITKINEEFGEIFTTAHVAAHKKHTQSSSVETYKAFYLKDDVLYLKETDDIVEFIAPKVALKVIVAIAMRNLLNSGGARLSARYLVETLKILSDMETGDAGTATILESWQDRLKDKPANVTVIENPKEQAIAYIEDQEKKRQAFEAKIGIT